MAGRGQFRTTGKFADFPGGFLEAILLENFCCHDNFFVEFGQRITFITGQNGSGKSAVFVGLQIALGSDAKFARKGSTVRGFVKDGAASGCVAVRLSNRGHDAHLPAKYGDAIIVERRVTRTGGGRYRLLNGRGDTVVSTKKEDLLVMLEHYNIHINNPISFMNQDTSKELLHATSAGRQYEEVVRATLLAQLEDDLEGLRQHILIIHTNVDDKEKELPALDQSVSDAKAVVDGLENLFRWQADLESYKTQLAWAYVEEVEQKVRTVEEKARRFDRANEEAEQKIRESEIEKERVLGEQKRQQQELQVIDQKLEERKSGRQALDREIGDLAKKRKEVGLKQKTVSAQKKKAEKMKDTHLSKIEKIRGQVEDREKEAVANRERVERELKQKEQESQDLESQISQLEKEADDLVASRDRARQMTDEAKRTLSSSKGDLKNAKDDLTRLQSSDPSRRVDTFLRNASRLRRLIEQNAHRFSQMPVGPIGSFIRMKDAQWRVPFEFVLRNISSAYIVNSYADDELLRDLSKTAGIQRLSINRVTMNAPRYRVNMPASDRRYVRFLDVLETDLDEIFNICVDVIKAETIVLVHPDGESFAKDLVFRKRVPNVEEAWMPSGRDAAARFFTAGRSENRVAFTNPRHLYEEDKTAAIQAVQSRCSRASQAIEYQQRAFADADAHWKQYERQAKAKQQEVGKCRTRSRKAFEKINDLREELDQYTTNENDDAEDISSWEEEVRHCEEAMSKCEQSLSALVAPLEEIQQRLKDRQRQYDQETAGDVELDAELEEANARFGKLCEDLAHHDSAVRHFQRERDKILDQKREENRKIAELQEELESRTAKASKYAPHREPVQLPTKRLSYEIQQTTKRIKTEERRQGGTREELTTRLEQARMKRDHAGQLIDKHRELGQDLADKYNDREQAFKKARLRVFQQTSTMFNQLLNRFFRFAGHLEPNHEEKTLAIDVEPFGQGEADKRTLSGGEGSFVQVSLLVALWRSVESPFYGWDEPNVYMDSFNEDNGMKLLVNFEQYCRENGRPSQIVLISPNSPDALEKEEMQESVNIVRLRKR